MTILEKAGMILMVGAVCIGTVDTDWQTARAILQVVFLVVGAVLFMCGRKE